MKARSLMVASCQLVKIPIRDIRHALEAHHAVMKDVVAGGVCNNTNNCVSSLQQYLSMIQITDQIFIYPSAVSLLAERCITAHTQWAVGSGNWDTVIRLLDIGTYELLMKTYIIWYIEHETNCWTVAVIVVSNGRDVAAYWIVMCLNRLFSIHTRDIWRTDGASVQTWSSTITRHIQRSFRWVSQLFCA